MRTVRDGVKSVSKFICVIKRECEGVKGARCEEGETR